DFLDFRVLSQYLLNLTRIDILTGRYDEILLAAGNAHKSIMVNGAQIPGVQPSVRDRFCCLIGHMVINSHPVPATNHDLTEHTGGRHKLVRSPQGNFQTRKRWPNRSQSSSYLPVQSDERCSLSLSIAFKNRYAETLFKGFCYGRRQRFASGNWESYRGKIEGAFCACKYPIHGWDGEENADFVFLNQSQDFRRLRAVHQNHLAAIR